ncbi:MAG: hypothetical protein AB8A39_05360 [Prochlorococcus sp.]
MDTKLLVRDRKGAQGAAAFHADLKKGVLTVRHTDENGPVLLRVPLYEGDWSALWSCMESLGKTNERYRATGEVL